MARSVPEVRPGDWCPRDFFRCIMIPRKLPEKLLLLSLLSVSTYVLVLRPSLLQSTAGRRRPSPGPRPAHGGAPPIALSHLRPAPPLIHLSSAVAPSVKRVASPEGVKGQSNATNTGGLGAAAEVPAVRHSLNETRPAAPPLKHILYWNEFYGSMEFMWGSGQKPFIEHGCEVNTCFGTNNRSLLKMHEYDAILFHVQSLPYFDWPKVRSAHQRYVFVTLESAQYVAIPLRHYDNLFNLTLTYRRDSDFPHPYGAMAPAPSPPPTSTRNYAVGKTKLVAWFVSHCSSKSSREQYVKRLQKYIPVDIYGGCGPLKCPRSGDNKCHKTLLNKEYKFYLSFENSICNDYVTEKLFDVLRYDVVPVVLGGANYSSYAPPGSYIDALKYNPKELASYLLELDKDDAAYNEYFKWKGKYQNVKKVTFQTSSFCDLCKYLHGNERKVYKNMLNWWVKGQCKRLKF